MSTRRHSPRNHGSFGFTLVELLVVIAIIGVLIALLLPAIQAAREAARRIQCANHVGEIAKAFANHDSAHGHYPTGGWQWTWVGDPDRGYGKGQPGSWPFNILEYIEMGQVRNMAAGLQGGASGTLKFQALTEMTAIAIPVYYCPSRRRAVASAPKNYLTTYQRNAGMPASKKVGKTDYSACVGYVAASGDDLNDEMAPNSVSAAATFKWNDDLFFDYDGICFHRSDISSADITDGTSVCYMVGEKFMPIGAYEGSWTTTAGEYSKCDNESCYTGYNRDFHASVHESYVPHQDCVLTDKTSPLYMAFGSPHAGGFNMSFCDGSVHHINFDINLLVHKRLGQRDDGAIVNMTELD